MTPYDSAYWQEQCEHWIAETVEALKADQQGGTNDPA